MQHTHSGRVHSVSTSHDGKHTTVEVVHGKRKRQKGPDGKPGELSSDHWDRPRSSITLPKSAGAEYSVGQRVHAGMMAADGADEGDEEGAGDMPVAKKPNPFMAKAKHGVADVRTSSPIKNAFKRKTGRAS